MRADLPLTLRERRQLLETGVCYNLALSDERKNLLKTTVDGSAGLVLELDKVAARSDQDDAVVSHGEQQSGPFAGSGSLGLRRRGIGASGAVVRGETYVESCPQSHPLKRIGARVKTEAPDPRTNHGREAGSDDESNGSGDEDKVDDFCSSTSDGSSGEARGGKTGKQAAGVEEGQDLEKKIKQAAARESAAQAVKAGAALVGSVIKHIMFFAFDPPEDEGGESNLTNLHVSIVCDTQELAGVSHFLAWLRSFAEGLRVTGYNKLRVLVSVTPCAEHGQATAYEEAAKHVVDSLPCTYTSGESFERRLRIYSAAMKSRLRCVGLAARNKLRVEAFVESSEEAREDFEARRAYESHYHGFYRTGLAGMPWKFAADKVAAEDCQQQHVIQVAEPDAANRLGEAIEDIKINKADELFCCGAWGGIAFNRWLKVDRVFKSILTQGYYCLEVLGPDVEYNDENTPEPVQRDSAASGLIRASGALRGRVEYRKTAWKRFCEEYSNLPTAEEKDDLLDKLCRDSKDVAGQWSKPPPRRKLEEERPSDGFLRFLTPQDSRASVVAYTHNAAALSKCDVETRRILMKNHIFFADRVKDASVAVESIFTAAETRLRRREAEMKKLTGVVLDYPERSGARYEWQHNTLTRNELDSVFHLKTPEQREQLAVECRARHSNRYHEKATPAGEKLDKMRRERVSMAVADRKRLLRASVFWFKHNLFLSRSTTAQYCRASTDPFSDFCFSKEFRAQAFRAAQQHFFWTPRPCLLVESLGVLRRNRQQARRPLKLKLPDSKKTSDVPDKFGKAAEAGILRAAAAAGASYLAHRVDEKGKKVRVDAGGVLGSEAEGDVRAAAEAAAVNELSSRFEGLLADAVDQAVRLAKANSKTAGIYQKLHPLRDRSKHLIVELRRPIGSAKNQKKSARGEVMNDPYALYKKEQEAKPLTGIQRLLKPDLGPHGENLRNKTTANNGKAAGDLFVYNPSVRRSYKVANAFHYLSEEIHGVRALDETQDENEGARDLEEEAMAREEEEEDAAWGLVGGSSQDEVVSLEEVKELARKSIGSAPSSRDACSGDAEKLSLVERRIIEDEQRRSLGVGSVVELEAAEQSIREQGPHDEQDEAADEEEDVNQSSQNQLQTSRALQAS
eukprot:g7504.t1